jgi:hypothetical protein
MDKDRVKGKDKDKRQYVDTPPPEASTPGLGLWRVHRFQSWCAKTQCWTRSYKRLIDEDILGTRKCYVVCCHGGRLILPPGRIWVFEPRVRPATFVLSWRQDFAQKADLVFAAFCGKSWPNLGKSWKI